MKTIVSNLTFFGWTVCVACLTTVLAPAASFAVPTQVAASGVLRNATGGPAPDGTYILVASIYTTEKASKPAWKELHNKVVVKAGMFALRLGVDGKLDSALLAGSAPLWLGIQVGGGNELPRVRLERVARAWHAKWADTAKTAQTAASASTAKNAETAKIANEAVALACTGCIQAKHLSKDVASAYVSTKGGTVDGKLEVKGGIDLVGGVLGNARLQLVEVNKTACDAKSIGRVVLGSVTRSPWFCNGKSWMRLRSCSGTCRKATEVACGQPVNNDCGDIVGCTGKGTFCAAGTCKNDKCTAAGDSAQNAALDCKAIKAADPTVKSGLYWLDPDGVGKGIPGFQAWCDMVTDGGGWTLTMATTHTTRWSGGSTIWHNKSADNHPITPASKGKAHAYWRVPGNEILFKTHGEKPGYWASFGMPLKSSVLQLVGETTLGSKGNGYARSIAYKKSGGLAHNCWKQTWRVSWRNYWSSDNHHDSSIFAPSAAVNSRPCGGSKAYATGIGVRTDTINGFGGYGGSFEGYGSDGAGNKALTSGYVAIYVR